MTSLVTCPTCRQQIQTRIPAGAYVSVAVTHLHIGVKCLQSGNPVITDQDVLDSIRPVECDDANCGHSYCAGGCLCDECDETRCENGPLFGEAQ